MGKITANMEIFLWILDGVTVCWKSCFVGNHFDGGGVIESGSFCFSPHPFGVDGPPYAS